MSSTKRFLEKLTEELAAEFCRRNNVEMSDEVMDNALKSIMESKNEKMIPWQSWVNEWIKNHESKLSK